MNLEERATHLQKCLEEATRSGAPYGDICMYESAIAEMLRISEWIRRQCKGRNRIYFERNGNGTRKYVKFKNDTGIDFRFVAMKVDVKRERKIIDTFELAAREEKEGGMNMNGAMKGVLIGAAMRYDAIDILIIAEYNQKVIAQRLLFDMETRI